ncbi:MAG: hypothetical protein IPM15_18370 [Betaproteobacteria bacterium]|nr:hypothetical protein [Betaproteobacteria bacterium]
MMVGIAVGLFIVAAATVMVSGQLGENRRLLLESQLQQDLRATSDIITRELRRAGAWRGSPEPGIANRHDGPAQANFTDMTPSAAGRVSDITFRYHRTPTEQGPWGFKLERRDGRQPDAAGASIGWQDLTDGNVMEVTTFSDHDRPRTRADELACPKLCPTTNDTSCWPVLQVRNFVVNIEARARNDTSITRRIRSVVRARNDWIEFRTTGGLAACPS